MAQCTMTALESESLRAALGALGFDEVRFTDVASSVAGDFPAWLAAGHQADMNWLERGGEKRLDAQRVLEGAQSMIVLGVNYLPGRGDLATQQRWAKYALHEDYHDTIAKGLHAAGRVLESRLGLTRADYRVYVDTGPVLERGWAARAGLGWQGKNAMLISREHGNWLFIATILLRVHLPPDASLKVARIPGASAPKDVGLYCGSCTRCLVACPTAAFPKPGWVDSRRCISYHTIENRGVIPRELRAAFGARVFGCDTCLDVCPWNRFAEAGRSALLSVRGEIAELTLPALLTMDEVRFRDVFRKTSIKRTRLSGLLRNACIAAGNWDDSTEWHFGAGADRSVVVAAVERLCAHDSEIVRTHAVWALFRLLGREEATARTVALQVAEQAPCVLSEYAAWAQAG